MMSIAAEVFDRGWMMRITRSLEAGVPLDATCVALVLDGTVFIAPVLGGTVPYGTTGVIGPGTLVPGVTIGGVTAGGGPRKYGSTGPGAMQPVAGGATLVRPKNGSAAGGVCHLHPQNKVAATTNKNDLFIVQTPSILGNGVGRLAFFPPVSREIWQF